MRDLLHGESKIKQSTAIIFLILTATLWSLGGLFIKLVPWNPVAISGVRSGIAALFLLIFIRRPRLTWSFAQIAGAFAYAGTVVFYVISVKLTTAANAILLEYTAPIYVAVFGVWLLKERLKPLDLMTVIFVMAGLVLFFLDKLSMGQLYGNLCAIASGICFALMFIFMRMQKNESTIETIIMGNIISALIGIPFMSGPLPDLSGWGALLFLGIIQLGLSYLLYSIAIKRVKAIEAILTACLDPILNPIWVLVFLGEIPGTWAVVGGFVVMVSTTGYNIISIARSNSKSRNASQSPYL